MLKIGIVGCGHWGKNYVRNIQGCDGAQLVAVSDLVIDRIHRIAGPNPPFAVYDDHAKMFAEAELDAVIVATQATTHFEVVSDALEAGLDVLAEKPFTKTVEEADGLIALAKEKGRIVMVAHTFLYNSAVRRLKEIVHDGTVGQVYYMKATRTHLGLIREDVNAVWDLAPHDISIFNYILDDVPSSVQASGARFLKSDHEDVAFVNLRYPGNIVASIHCSWADSNKQRSVEVVGSNARVVFNDLDLVEPIRVFMKGVAVKEEGQSFGEFKYAIRDGDIISPKIQSSEPLRTLCEHFLSSIRHRTAPDTPDTDGREVVRVLQMIDRGLADNMSTITEHQ